jgi:hypothetical protein
MKPQRPTMTIREIGDLARSRDQARSDPTVRIRRLHPELLRPVTEVRCVRCGRPGATPVDSFRAFHDECRPKPGPKLVLVTDSYEEGRISHLSRKDRRRVLEWLGEHGPATARMIGWALGLDQREVQLLMWSLEGSRVERPGLLVTGRRGHPPTVWRLLQAEDVAA